MSTQERKTPPASFGFPRQARITRGAELQRIAREGKRIRTMHLEVRVATSPLVRSAPGSVKQAMGTIRIGLVVPKYKQSSVARNRVKRQLRELARLHLLPSGISADLVIRIRPEAYLATFEMLMREVLRALAQLQQWDEVGGPRSSPTIVDAP